MVVIMAGFPCVPGEVRRKPGRSYNTRAGFCLSTCAGRSLLSKVRLSYPQMTLRDAIIPKEDATCKRFGPFCLARTFLLKRACQSFTDGGLNRQRVKAASSAR